MIEHPEAVTIAGQIDATLRGKRIASALRGNTPHKWAFYSRAPDQKPPPEAERKRSRGKKRRS
jgi:hypothetical protein